MIAPAKNYTLERLVGLVEADVPLSDSVVDFSYKTQQHQETAAVSPLQDPFTCLLSHGIHLGDYIAILDYSFACTGLKVLQWTPKSHMVEFGSHYEIPEKDHLGRRKRVAVVSERLTVELPNPSLPYLPFCKNLDRLVKTPATAVAGLSAPINAFPENVRRIICSKVIHSDTGKTYPEVVGLCVLEYELFTPPASTVCCKFQGFSVTERHLSKRHKLIFKRGKYIRQAQNSVRSARVKPAPPPNRSVPRPILAAISPPTSIMPNIVTVRNSDSSSNSSAGVSSSNSGAS
ncbi:hypothetical protein BGX30_013278 [Mortierella sp. GBA39]|nr:hypothetical protein BGX30_013278 [Mortierella sp. GBA39]